MKTTNLIILTMALGLMGLMSGCSKSNSQNNNNGVGGALVPPVIVDPNAPVNSNTTPTFSGGGTSVFVPVSQPVMEKYVATHPLNAPTNYRVNVNLAHVESARYGGTVTISYIDNGVQYDGIFESGTGRNYSADKMYDNNVLESEYNYFFTHGGATVFTGQFEDQYGAIVLALEPESTSSSGNDAEPIANKVYKGKIYFKNFEVQRYETYWFQTYGGAPTATQGPYRSCWFIYRGPYDCRSSVIQNKTGMAPGAGAGYTELGSFSGLKIKEAFNIN